MKAGAVDFLSKAADPSELIEAVRRALAKGARSRGQRDMSASTRKRLERLSTRERAVLDRVVAGRRNRQIAAELGITERTVKFHRTNIMQKMEVASVAELARLMEHHEPDSPNDG